MSTKGFEQRLLDELTTIYDQRTHPPRATPVRPAPRRLRRPAVLAGAAAGLVLAGGATAAATMVFSDRDKNIGPGMADTVAPGETTRIKGMDCVPGSLVTVRLDGATIGTTTAETQPEGPEQLVLGWYVVDVTIPAGAASGPHTLTVTCPFRGDGLEMVQTKTITVAP